ncbi:formylglycine-generating enzyme family protein [Jiella sonneratiae]|uniref:Formylglycine-generating enzyme family protein n=1 Tax=Jiella sonneratiae TaxID=2816856 RepID=A0ABS3J552_9HYPH|nr:formylglycine-generating enzyme family protein [Jiella sonneratiae]MBO0904782.1 formylglycine-generating enzyme family protein [Jiella sonneratiae]
MVRLEGGRFVMGSDRFYPEERPAHPVEVGPFRIDRHAVSNDDFDRFVKATGYVTTAEIPLSREEMPGAPAELLAAGSLVFRKTDGPVPLRDFRAWWRFVPGASWRAPEGPGSSIDGRRDHPVVHVSLHDAAAYAAWAGKTLPSEAQWEFAARAGSDTTYPWGDDFTPDGRVMANTWHGAFPFRNDRVCGPVLTCPVDAFEPSAFGLFNMIGNVWEWTATKFTASHKSPSPCCAPGAGDGPVSHVLKGGSFLCAPSYCRRYRASARSPQEARSSTNHIGFRCAAPADGDPGGLAARPARSGSAG